MENEEPWKTLTIPDVVALNKTIYWTRRSKVSRRTFFRTVAELSDSMKQDLHSRALTFLERRTEEREAAKDEERIRKLGEKDQRMIDSILQRHEKFDNLASTENFLTDVGEDTKKDLLAKFIEETSMKNVKQAVCCSCAGLFEEVDLYQMSLTHIPHRYLLQPVEQHPAHILTDGLLLEKRGLLEEGTMRAHLCRQCDGDLRSKKIPRFSLANNMWIGETPFQLDVLTVPERILISIYYPSVYVYKLYPKSFQKGGRAMIMNEKMCGNVTTYRLAPQRMADLATGALLPRKPDILASLISITMVGRNKIPEKTLKGLLQIRRSRVLAAILWLKSNNPFYKNIDIDVASLENIPEGGIPDSILTNVRIIDDIQAFNKENETYVPNLDDESDGGIESDIDLVDNDAPECLNAMDDIHELDDSEQDTEAKPNIYPLQETAVVDVNGVDVDPAELFYQSVQNSTCYGNVEGLKDSPSESFESPVEQHNPVENTEDDSMEGSHDVRTEDAVEPQYHYQHGTAYVNEYPRRNEKGERYEGSEDNPNHFLGAFPYLFPYGLGGFETKRTRPVSYGDHAKWALRYFDGRFSKNMTFMSQVFNVLQKREVCRASDIQVSRRDFVKYEKLFKQITVQDLQAAADRERKGLPVTDFKVKKLRQMITATRRHVRGTDENRQRLRSRIHGMTMMKGPPSLWITLNFADTKDPLVQVFAGADINMDDIRPESSLSAENMTKNACENPVAAAKAFFFMMKLFFEVLLGIKVTTTGHLKRQMGIFGITESYIGSVEAQGRGTLHAHLLIWLSGSPTCSQMQAMLKDEVFRKRMEDFIAINIRSHVEGLDELYLETETSKDLRSLKKVATAYSRPLDPREKDFEVKAKQFEFASARVHHVHVCSSATCLVPNKKGQIRCKRRAPWKLATETRVYENGEWESKRKLKWLNTWCFLIMLSFRCNHDIKVLINAGVSKDLAWYITKYASKAQGKSFNESALLATRYAHNQQNMSKAATLRDANKKMLSQCVNTLSRYQELSSQQLAALLMGWGDRFESHTYVPIHLRALMASLKEQFPELNSSPVYNEQERSDTVYETQDESLMLSLQASVSTPGLQFKSQVREYMDRGHLLETYSFLLFHLETYEAKNRVKSEEKIRHIRVPYLGEIEMYRGRVRVLRSDKAEIMPDFLGSWPPRNDSAECREMYCCTMLALFKPWRHWSDLKCSFKTWDEAFQAFFSTCSQRCKNIMENIQFYYESRDTATANRAALADDSDNNMVAEDASNQPMLSRPSENVEEAMSTVSEDTIDEPSEKPSIAKERFFGEKAIEIGKGCGIFSEHYPADDFRGCCSAVRASTDVIEVLDEWKSAMQADDVDAPNDCITAEEDTNIGILDNEDQMESVSATISADDNFTNMDSNVKSIMQSLTTDQRRACILVDKHLSQHLRGDDTQLLMLLMGSGGVGKSVVIKAIEDIFKVRRVSKLLAKTATTGVAASHIQGSTIHFWAGLSIYTPPANGSMRMSSTAIIKRRDTNMKETRYLIIDEISMFTLPNLGLLSKLVADIQDPTGENRGLPFGGKLNVILVGDFHQFPPPAMNKFVLFRQQPPFKHTWAQIGFSVFSCFKTVVVLRQQMRSVDKGWSEILDRVRYCETTEEDILELRKLTLTRAECDIPDFGISPWNRAVLITTRHAVREAWNESMTRKISLEERKTVLICPSHDYTGKGKVPLTTEETEANRKHEDGWKLPRKQEMFEGMRIIITYNIAVKSHLANGSIGILEKIYLDPREPPVPEGEHYHHLQYTPVLLLFRPDKYRNLQLKRLPEGILPIEPSKLSRQINLKRGKKATIHREQFAVTAAYAFTDYKSQGQTLSPLIIDIAKPPTGVLTPFNTYVALSRSKSREYTRILRDFDTKLFTQPMDEDLQQFDAELDKMDKETKRVFEETIGILEHRVAST